MSLIERIMLEPELREKPPVLVDVGAAGGVNPLWRDIARYCIGVGFEPDARDAAKLKVLSGAFARWIYCDRLVAPVVEGPTKPFYLTKSPHCSSLLKPSVDKLKDWMFADFFEVERLTEIPATTLRALLEANGLERVDWLKCDTQGQDLSIFMSLPSEWRRQVQAVEFEPGLIDAYEGEDKLWHTLRTMDGEPFWICDLKVCGTQRGDAAVIRAMMGAEGGRWLRRLAPSAPGWVNLRYLRRLDVVAKPERRALLLGWVFADILGQNTHAALVAEAGRRAFGGELFDAMCRRSLRRVRLSMIRRAPGWLWHRLGFGA
jgi:FkbM family methyltransferase